MSQRHSTARVGPGLILFLAVACVRAAPPVTPVVHRFDAGEAGIFVNAYLVETPSGIVAIDATLTESSSKALRATLDSLGKPLLAVLLTHGHPDHYNGVTNLVAGATAGDEVLHGVHAYTADGHTTRWLANLDNLSAALQGVATIYPGHGDPGGSGILVWQRDYLLAYRQAVAQLSRDQSTLTPAAKTELVARMKRYLPTTRLDFLIALGADPVAAELR